MAEPDLTAAIEAAADAIEAANRRPWKGDDRGWHQRDARAALEAAAPLLIEQGRRAGYDTAADDMVPTVDAGYAAGVAEGRRQAAAAILAEADRITAHSFTNPPPAEAHDRADVLRDAARIAEGEPDA